MLQISSSEELTKAAAVTASSHRELTVRKEVKNYKNSTQKLKKLSSPQPWRIEKQKSYRLSLNTSLQNSDENSFIIRGKNTHTMQGLD